MKKIGILCAMDSEFDAIRTALQHGETQKIGAMLFYVGDYAGKRVIAATCGIGKVNAAACTQAMIGQLGVDCVINSGVAGALSPALRILDFVVANETLYHDCDMHLLKKYSPHCAHFVADEQVSALAAQICVEQGNHCVRGLIVSGDQFIEDSAVKQRIIEHTSADAVEMEGAAIGHVCTLNSTPFAIIRCISDGANDAGAMDFDTFVAEAAQRSARVTLALIERLP